MFPLTMNTAVSELAYRTAMTAGPFADALTMDMQQIAISIRYGDLDHALESFDTNTDRLQRFLTFLVVASELLMDCHAPLGAVIGDYSRRLLNMVGRIEDALAEGDLVGLTLALEHGLARSLAEYSAYENDIRVALTPRLAA